MNRFDNIAILPNVNFEAITTKWIVALSFVAVWIEFSKISRSLIVAENDFLIQIIQFVVVVHSLVYFLLI